jgi:hypothetical protein
MAARKRKRERLIRHFDGSMETAHKISAQAKRGSIKVVQWGAGFSLPQHRIVPTLAEGERLVAVWAKWQTRQGHRVRLNPRWARWYPEGLDGVVRLGHHCRVHEYDPGTRMHQ